jgi:hypothetical protein
MDILYDFSKIAIFCPSVLFCKTIGDKILRPVFDIFLSETEKALIFRRGLAFCFSEKCTERTDAVKSYTETNVRYCTIFLQKDFGIFNSYPDHVLMRRASVDGFEKADEMKFRKITLAGNMMKVYISVIITINK